MDCHLFCHNELPAVLAALPLVTAGLALARKRIASWLRR